MLGAFDVKLGALAGLATDKLQTVSRRMALNTHLLLQGTLTSSLSVVLPTQDHLIINMATAKSIGWSPDYDTSLAAEFIHYENKWKGEKMARNWVFGALSRPVVGPLASQFCRNIQVREHP